MWLIYSDQQLVDQLYISIKLPVIQTLEQFPKKYTERQDECYL